MIRRESGDEWLLVSQVDHARLAARIAGEWGNADVPPLPVTEPLVRTIRLHDDGWFGWEAAPTIDPETGRPRDFTEMPMAEATAIWTRSIAVAGRGQWSRAEALQRFEAYLRANDVAATRARMLVLDAVLNFDSRFSAEELVDVLSGGGPEARVSRPTVYRTLAFLQEAGVVDDSHQVVVPTVGADALGGTWVSRHFGRLAEQARENRDDPADLVAIESFLDQQEEQREAWRPAIELLAGEDVDRLVDAGHRLLRFFDWISLWICCAERTEGTDMPTPGGPAIRFEPDGTGRFTLDPWPLRVANLTIGVPARAIPAGRCAGNDELHERLRRATETHLEWQLVPAR